MKSKNIADIIDQVIYIADLETYEMYYMNEPILKLLGYPSDSEWKGRTCYDLLQGLEKPCSFCTNHLLNKEEFYQWEYYNPHLDKYYDLQDKLIDFEGKTVRLEVGQDITNSKTREKSLLYDLAEQRVLNACIDTLHSLESPDTCIHNLLQIITEYHHAERGYIFDISPCGNFVNNTYEWCLEGITPQIEILQNVDICIVEHWFVKYEEVGEFYIDSLDEEVDSESEEYKILDSQGITSVVTAPLLDMNGNLIGFIGIDNPQFYAKNTQVIRKVAKFISDFFDKMTLLKEVETLRFIDHLTGVRNRHSYDQILKQYQEKKPTKLGIISIGVNHLRNLNRMHDYQYTNQHIISIAHTLEEMFPHCVYRVNGDEFVVLVEQIQEETFYKKIERLQNKMLLNHKKVLSIGYTWEDDKETIWQSIQKAEKFMYGQKEEEREEFI